MTGMGGYVVAVTFRIDEAHRAAFREAVVENARLSLSQEPGCQVFDVCASAEGGEIFLYEVYASEAAFKDHLATEHFRDFDGTVASWVVDKRVLTYDRLSTDA